MSNKCLICESVKETSLLKVKLGLPVLPDEQVLKMTICSSCGMGAEVFIPPERVASMRIRIFDEFGMKIPRSRVLEIVREAWSPFLTDDLDWKRFVISMNDDVTKIVRETCYYVFLNLPTLRDKEAIDRLRLVGQLLEGRAAELVLSSMEKDGALKYEIMPEPSEEDEDDEPT